MAIPAVIFGDTFLATCTYKDSTGAPVDLDTAGITVAATFISPSGQRMTPGTVTFSDQVASPGQFTVTADTSTFTDGDAEPSRGRTGIDLLYMEEALYPLPVIGRVCGDSSNVDNPPIGRWNLKLTYTSAQGKFSSKPIYFEIR